MECGFKVIQNKCWLMEPVVETVTNFDYNNNYDDTSNKQLLPGLLVDSADYHPEKELFPEGNARGK